MKNFCKVILAICIILALVKCEKDTTLEDAKKTEFPNNVFIPDDLKEILINNDYRGGIRTRSVEQKDNWSTVWKADPADCDGPELSMQPYNIQDLFIREIRDGVCGFRLAGQSVGDSIMEVVQTLHSRDSTIWNCFLDGLFECATNIGSIYFVREGEGNFSPFQLEVVAKYTFYPHFYPFFNRPIYTVSVIEGYEIIIAVNKDHNLNGVPYSGSFCDPEYVPLLIVFPEGEWEVGDKIELYNDNVIPPQ